MKRILEGPIDCYVDRLYVIELFHISNFNILLNNKEQIKNCILAEIKIM